MQTDQQRGGRVMARLLDARDQFLGYIRKRIDDPELAEDILQDSLLRAIRAAPDLRDILPQPAQGREADPHLQEHGQHWRSETVAELGGAILLAVGLGQRARLAPSPSQAVQ